MDAPLLPIIRKRGIHCISLSPVATVATLMETSMSREILVIALHKRKDRVRI
jgi:hypothetical protein